MTRVAVVAAEFFAGRMFAPQVDVYEAAFIDPLSEIWPRVLAAVRRMLSMPPGV